MGYPRATHGWAFCRKKLAKPPMSRPGFTHGAQFRPLALLHAIVGTPSVSLGGVNSQSPRLEISAKGEFGDLGSVGVSRNTTANILSQGQAMQDGASVSYESTTDRYVVQKPNVKVRVFNRKLNPSGRKTNY